MWQYYKDEYFQQLEYLFVHLDHRKRQLIEVSFRNREFGMIRNIVGKAYSMVILRVFVQILKRENALNSDEGNGSEEKSSEYQENQIDIGDIKVISMESEERYLKEKFCNHEIYESSFSRVSEIQEKFQSMTISGYQIEDESKPLDTHLPIHKYENEIIEEVRKNRITIIKGDTGCGKTTQVPQMLMKHFKKIIISLPKKLAAKSIAKRVAEEMDTDLGDLVGYNVRFDGMFSKNTRILFVTDGILSSICLNGNIKDYDLIMIDEFHERRMYYDFVISYFLCNDLNKLVLMSATINTDFLVKQFKAGLVEIPVRVFENQMIYLDESNLSIVKSVSSTISMICRESSSGDILVFLPGIRDIDDIAFQLKNTLSYECEIIKLSGGSSLQAQSRIFEAMDKRKIILSTNIAESAVTVNTLVYVIDSGLVKRNYFRDNMTSLEVTKISKASADQRAGRVGRTSPGCVFRMYTEKEYNIFEEEHDPEIVFSDISSLILKFMMADLDFTACMKMLGYKKIKFFNSALNKLLKLDCIDNHGKLTDMGRKVAGLPLRIEHSKVLIRAKELNVFNEVAMICSMIDHDQLFYQSFQFKKRITQIMKKYSDDVGDHISYMNLYFEAITRNFSKKFCKQHFIPRSSAITVENTFSQLRRIFKYKKKFNFNSLSRQTDYDKVLLALCDGFLLNIAKRKGNAYVSLYDGHLKLRIHPSSSLAGHTPDLLLFDRTVCTTSHYMMNCTEIQPEMLLRLRNSFRIKK